VKVFISADMEGCTGVVSWSQCERPDGKSYDYEFARRMMTHDVNAAIRGAWAGGASEIVVKDSHGNSKNLLIDQLEAGVQLISGHGAGADGMMTGIDASFGAAFMVGYHAMAGTGGGLMEHTITGSINAMWVNGEPCGEIGLGVGAAADYGVPVILVSSDDHGCREAQDLVPGIHVAETKSGIGRYMAKLSHPAETGPLIERMAAKAMREVAPLGPKTWAQPTTVKIRFNRSEQADKCADLPGIERIDGLTIETTKATFGEAHRTVWALISLQLAGLNAQW
jgi:D-amino peptidase